MNSEGNPESKCYLCVEIIREEFKCLGNCPICGKCNFPREREAEDLYADYIDSVFINHSTKEAINTLPFLHFMNLTLFILLNSAPDFSLQIGTHLNFLEL